MMYFILAIAIVTNASANFLLKLGMKKGGSLDGLSLMDIIFKMATNYLFWGGVGCFIINLVAYSYALSKMQLSIAYPIMTSVGYALIVFSSILFLKESLTLIQSAGLVLIITGVVMLVK